MEASEIGCMGKKKITVKKTHGVGEFRSVSGEFNYRSAISPQDSQEGRENILGFRIGVLLVSIIKVSEDISN